MTSRNWRPTKACLWHVRTVWLCVGALFCAATPSFSESMPPVNYNAWRWSGSATVPSLAPPQTSSTIASHYAASTASSSSAASLVVASLIYSEVAGSFNFGVGTASLSGLVFYDKNGNGLQDISQNDWGIAGATIALTKVGSNSPALNLLSNSDGSFKFTGLPAGTYTLAMLTPSSAPGQDVLGVVQNKSGNIVAANAGTVTTDMFSNIILGDGYTGINYAFAEASYPISLISKRMMLNSDPGYARPQIVQEVPEPSSLLLLAIVGLALGMCLARRGR